MTRAWGGGSRERAGPARREDLVAHVRSGFKEPSDWLLGLEFENLEVHPDGRALPYYGPGGVEDLLSRLEREFGLAAHREEGHIVGLEGEMGAGIALEPGGQVEFTSAPRRSVAELDEDICRHLDRVVARGGEGRRLLALGLQPLTPLDRMQWISRDRYRIMARHLGARGDLAHRMMTQTAGVQANLDFRDDADLAAKLRTSMGVTSLVTALFANSPLSEGRPTGWASYRAHIWTRTDPERCGLVRGALEGDGMDAEAWAEYALDVPLMFLVRGARYVRVGSCTFRQFLERGWQGFHADVADWELHLTTLFPEVRVKTYLEVRGMDAVDRRLALAGVALWKGLLYSRRALEEAWRLVADLSWEERLRLHDDAAREGTRAFLRGRPLSAWGRDLVRIAREGLEDASRAVPTEGESAFLEPLQERTEEERGCPAEEILRSWEGEWEGEMTRLVEHAALAPCPSC